jgi:hypothetical protein
MEKLLPDKLCIQLGAFAHTQLFNYSFALQTMAITLIRMSAIRSEQRHLKTPACQWSARAPKIYSHPLSCRRVLAQRMVIWSGERTNSEMPGHKSGA